MKTENRSMTEIAKTHLAKLRNAERVIASLLVLLFSRMQTLETREAVETEWQAFTEFAKTKFAVSSLSEVAVLRSAKTLYSQYRKVSEVDGHGEVRKLENNSSLQSRYRAILKEEKAKRAEAEKPAISKVESAINALFATCEGLIQQNQQTEENVVSKIAELQNALIAETGYGIVRELGKRDEVKEGYARKAAIENAEAAGLAN